MSSKLLHDANIPPTFVNEHDKLHTNPHAPAYTHFKRVVPETSWQARGYRMLQLLSFPYRALTSLEEG
ncbi:MAG: hypothetical protein DRN99_07525 [Thermoproteota archaeon]|nr:MAG: hypothetical protein DRN99_07525 [Candidatus Korarchaeota archaeon]